MLLAGRSRVALLLFVALCWAALVSSVFLQVQRRSSTGAALVSAAILIKTDILQEMLSSVHADLLLALCVFWAAVYCGEAMHWECAAKSKPLSHSDDRFVSGEWTRGGNCCCFPSYCCQSIQRSRSGGGWWPARFWWSCYRYQRRWD